MVMIDECHATGFVGKTGRGTPELHNVMDRVDIINSTLVCLSPAFFARVCLFA